MWYSRLVKLDTARKTHTTIVSFRDFAKLFAVALDNQEEFCWLLADDSLFRVPLTSLPALLIDTDTRPVATGYSYGSYLVSHRNGSVIVGKYGYNKKQPYTQIYTPSP